MRQILIAAALQLSCASCFAASVTFDWNPSEGATPQTTYRLHCGQAPGLYGAAEDMPSKPYTKEMPTGVYYCAATAIDPVLGESAKSNEYKLVVPLPAPTNFRTITIIFVQ